MKITSKREFLTNLPPEGERFFHVWQFPRQEIEQVQFGDFLEYFGPNVPRLREYMGQVGIIVDGFNDDDRELWAIPQVVHFFKNLLAVWEYPFYFININSHFAEPGLQLGGLIYFTLEPYVVYHKNHPGFELKTKRVIGDLGLKTWHRWFGGMNRLMYKAGYSLQDNKIRTEQVMQALWGQHTKNTQDDQKRLDFLLDEAHKIRNR